MKKNPEPHCPGCKSCEVIPLLSALPGFAPYDTADLGRLPFGQCTQADADVMETVWECEECGHRWQERATMAKK
ncbi:MAG: hypothetical protein ABFD96_11510 [Armatimonadia bacterium]